MILTPDAAQKELTQLLEDIDAFEKRIAKYEKYGVLPDEEDSRYVFDFEFKSVPDNTKFPLVQKTLQVKKNTIFYMKGYAQAYTVVGTAIADGNSATLTLPQTSRMNMFDFEFKARDTGSDREWQNDWIPGTLPLTGNYHDFRWRKGHILASPGAELVVQVNARFFTNIEFVSGLSAITAHRLQLSLIGFEVPYKEGA